MTCCHHCCLNVCVTVCVCVCVVLARAFVWPYVCVFASVCVCVCSHSCLSLPCSVLQTSFHSTILPVLRNTTHHDMPIVVGAHRHQPAAHFLREEVMNELFG